MGADARIAHYGPASTYANYRGRIYVRSRAMAVINRVLAMRRSPYTDIVVEELQSYFACLTGYFRKGPFLLYQADCNSDFGQIHDDIELIEWQTGHLIMLRLRYQ